jgi:hypothetical protein
MSERERYEAAVAQAIEIAARNPLPLTARSLTAAENGAMQRRELGCLFDGGARLLLLLPLLLLLSGDPAIVWRAAPWCVGAAPLVWGLGRLLKWRAGRHYVDPRIKLEAGADGLTVWHGEQIPLPCDYADLSVAVRPGAFDRNPFLGLVLELPEGPILLDNHHYKNGRTTGAAILVRVQAAGGSVRPAQD